jgi:ABC-type phosphate/phosphonate transport system substrate-binding protein
MIRGNSVLGSRVFVGLGAFLVIVALVLGAAVFFVAQRGAKPASAAETTPSHVVNSPDVLVFGFVAGAGKSAALSKELSPLKSYLKSETTQPVKFRVYSNDSALATGLYSNDVDLALLSGVEYASLLSEKSEYEPVVAVTSTSQGTDAGTVVAVSSATSKITKLSQFTNQKVCLADKESVVGRQEPVRLMAGAKVKNVTPLWAGSAAASAQKVAQTTDCSMGFTTQEGYEKNKSALRKLASSVVPGSPILLSQKLTGRIRSATRTALLHMTSDKKGREIAAKVGFQDVQKTSVQSYQNLVQMCDITHSGECDDAG